jgi:putative DNA primase/helicase
MPAFSIEGLVSEYQQSRRRAGLSHVHLLDLNYRLGRFVRDFGAEPVRALSPEAIEDWLHGLALGPKSYNNFRSRLSALFSYGCARHYLDSNPVAAVALVKVVAEPPEIFTPEELSSVLYFASDELLPALSIGAFAGLRTSELLNFPGAGIHFYGDTTKGKTTVLEADASIWGQGQGYLRPWRATANGLEGTCVQHTDTLLVLDEIAEINSKDLNEVAYFLVNGQGKTRSDRHGEAKQAKSWRVPLLSSGEESLRTKLAAVGISVKEGQSLRILDIPSLGKYGLFDDLHEFKSGAEFADAIRGAANQHYGHAGPAFVKALIVQNRADLAQRHAEIVLRFSTQNPQEARASRCFALAALAGELATEAGVVPWEADDATSAALHVFAIWRDARETSVFGAEHFQILSRISDFIDAHSDSRFSDLNWTPGVNQYGNIINDEPKIYNRAGYWDDSGNSRVYLFTNGGLKEATKGFEFGRVLKALEDAGAFAKKGANAKAISTRTPDNRTPRLYWIDPEKLDQGKP